MSESALDQLKKQQSAAIRIAEHHQLMQPVYKKMFERLVTDERLPIMTEPPNHDNDLPPLKFSISKKQRQP